MVDEIRSQQRFQRVDVARLDQLRQRPFDDVPVVHDHGRSVSAVATVVDELRFHGVPRRDEYPRRA
ncbi:hypothetical protein [Nannocystis pusilla]|uniref:hypothetical protein n=1 Tax=Nannocystis pusilla TaxID=889268 RepID=UPI003B7AECEA